MIFRYADPALDAEYCYEVQRHNQKMWEAENDRGPCFYCGKTMYEGAYDIGENCVYDEEEDVYCHEWCRIKAQEEREEEAFDEMMEHPMEELESLVAL